MADALLLDKAAPKPLHCGMKLIFLSGLSLLLSFSFLSASPGDQKGGAKITKNEAQHIALQHYPGARVTAAKLETVQGKLVWSIEIIQPKSKAVSTVAVDATSGHIAAPKKDGH
jgi:Peptidase propeptide and YPEB domain